MHPTRRSVITCLAAMSVACGRTGLLESDEDSDTETDTQTETDTPNPCDVVAGTEAEGWQRLGFDAFPSLEEPGGYDYEDVGADAVIVARVDVECTIAIGRSCTHEGARLVFERGKFVCPKHGSVFRFDGSPFAGPAEFTGSVVALPAGITDDAIMVKPT